MLPAVVGYLGGFVAACCLSETHRIGSDGREQFFGLRSAKRPGEKVVAAKRPVGLLAVQRFACHPNKGLTMPSEHRQTIVSRQRLFLFTCHLHHSSAYLQLVALQALPEVAVK